MHGYLKTPSGSLHGAKVSAIILFSCELHNSDYFFYNYFIFNRQFFGQWQQSKLKVKKKVLQLFCIDKLLKITCRI